MRFTVNKSEEAVQESSGSGAFINKSGIYDVNLNYIQVAETKRKALQLNFNVTHQGMEQTIYGPIIQNTDGKLNEITADLMNRLCVVVGMEDGTELETVTAEYPVGKKQTLTEMEVFDEPRDKEVKMRIQMEYSVYEDKIQERKAIKAFYRTDGATAAEATTGDNIGRRLELDQEKYANNVTYRDGLTEEDVNEWLKAQREAAAGKEASKTAPKAAPAAKRPMFGNK